MSTAQRKGDGRQHQSLEGVLERPAHSIPSNNGAWVAGSIEKRYKETPICFAHTQSYVRQNIVNHPTERQLGKAPALITSVCKLNGESLSVFT